jgi:hypothetical protein
MLGGFYHTPIFPNRGATVWDVLTGSGHTLYTIQGG